MVFTPATVEEAAETVGELLHDRDLRDRVGQRGYRLVHREHTYERRVAALLEDIGLETPTTSTPSVDVICVSDRPHQVEHVFANFERQVNVDASLVFVTNADGFDIDGLRNRIEAVPVACSCSLRTSPRGVHERGDQRVHRYSLGEVRR